MQKLNQCTLLFFFFVRVRTFFFLLGSEQTKQSSTNYVCHVYNSKHACIKVYTIHREQHQNNKQTK